MTDYEHCLLCPRQCGIDRTRAKGRCGCTSRLLLSRAALHFWEEPCISGSGEQAPGSGTVFFSGCSLGCAFCQNYEISRGAKGKEATAGRLAEIFLQLQNQGAANINLVTPDHYLPHIEAAMALAKPSLTIPVAANCSGYETPETIARLAAFTDIFMPDLKFFSEALSGQLAGAPDYFAVARRAVLQMVELAGKPVFDGDGMLKSGVIIRHLVLPGHKDDSLALLDFLSQNLEPDAFVLSLMSQYTPYRKLPWPELNRRLSTYEYRTVTDAADRLGFALIYTQQRSAAKEEYTPPFDFEGV